MNKYDICGFDKEEELNNLHDNSTEIMKMYDLVFEDIVNNVLAERDDLKQKVCKIDVQCAVHKMIYDSDYMWEVINENAEQWLEFYIKEEEEENE